MSKKTKTYMDELMKDKEFRDKFDKEYQRISSPKTFKKYQKKCLETWIPGDFKINDLSRVILGLVGESGEVAEVYKKYLRGDYEKAKNMREDLKKELGDVLYYWMMICWEFRIDLDDILETNIKKLRSRKERGKIKGRGDNR